MTSILDIPRVNTPTGGWHGEMPGPFLTAATEPLVAGAPDLRGTWRALEVTINGERAPEKMPMWKHIERIEQVGDRVIVTAGHVIHDFAHVDGTFENGCHDVLEMDLKTPMVVSASYEDGVLVLRPQGIPGIEVKRWRDGEFLMWEYHGAFSMKLERII